MKTNILGYPRIGAKRELKKAIESYWKKQTTEKELLQTAASIRRQNWQLQEQQHIDLIPSNDFSLYDQVLDASLSYGCIPARFEALKKDTPTLRLYFAMARGLQSEEHDITALEMTKWFDTNYHYLVPEFTRDQSFSLFSHKATEEYREALTMGIHTKPVVLSPVSFLLLGKEKESGFHRIELLDKLLPVFCELIDELVQAGATYIQLDEPCLSLDLTDEEQKAITRTYKTLADRFPTLRVILTSYFDCYGSNLETVLQLPIHALHLDLVRCPSQLDDISSIPSRNPDLTFSLGLVDGRNVWINNFEDSLALIRKAKRAFGKDKLWIATSCSLLHSPCDLELETTDGSLPPAVKQWMAFARQKVDEVATLKRISTSELVDEVVKKLTENNHANQRRKNATLIHHAPTQQRISALKPADSQRKSPFAQRQPLQRKALQLPLLPTTTIGSFPQTREVRNWRAKWKKGQVGHEEYHAFIREETEKTIRWQENTGLDMLVHGEFERNDMVEYFGEKLEGFAFTAYGWVQSYGTRCVKPPIIYGDVYRASPMTVEWSAYAQSLTSKPVKGMLTGPVTILQWSFVRNDQPRAVTCRQIALAIRDEVVDLEKAGLRAIQIDEPAIREGLPLRKAQWQHYLHWAVECFRLAASGVADSTQIHTHMCYSEFNDIIENIADMDADVITIETSRSEMELLDAFVNFKYPNEIGPGVYDIHSPRVPSVAEIEKLLTKAGDLLPLTNLWVNPDCGLKTREWAETQLALQNMVTAARQLRERECEAVV